MLDFWHGCKMSNLCTAFPSFPKEGETPLHTLKNCAKIAAKINVREVIPIDELRPSWRCHLEFYTFSSRPPVSSYPPSASHRRSVSCTSTRNLWARKGGGPSVGERPRGVKKRLSFDRVSRL